MLHEETTNVLLAHPSVDVDFKDDVGFTAFRVGVICTLPHKFHYVHALSDFGCEKTECRQKAVNLCKTLLACGRCKPPPEEIRELEAAADMILKDSTRPDNKDE